MVIKIKSNLGKEYKGISGGIYSAGKINKNYYYIIGGNYENTIIRAADCEILSPGPCLKQGIGVDAKYTESRRKHELYLTNRGVVVN